jgi:flavin reductase (DIM6/NTAB) family NADH-FMN oxidoreductase RutF
VSADARGQLNAAPFSFFNVFCDDPPIVCLGVMGRNGSLKDTAANIRATREFVVNLVPEQLAAQMNETAAEFPHEVDELALAGLTTAASLRVAVPRIAECPVALECTATDFLEQGGGRVIVIARVLAVSVHDAMVLDAERCYIDTPKLQLIGRMHGSGEYARTSDLFNMPRPSTPADAPMRGTVPL